MMKIENVLFMRSPLLFDARLGHEEPHPPLELLYLAASIRGRYNVSLLDGMLNIRNVKHFRDFFYRAGMSDEELKNAIAQASPQVVCIGAMWINQKEMLEYVVQLVKSIDPSIIVIVGGLLPSSLFKLLIEHPCIDYVVVGEGEPVLPLLLESIEKGSDVPLAGVASKRDDGSRKISPVLAGSIDSIPLPAYDLVEFGRYSSAYKMGHVKSMPFIGVLPTRGCTYWCTFCSLPNVTGRSFRHHSIESTIENFKLLKEKYGIREFHFYDANLLNNPKFAKDLFRAMIKNKVNMPWLPEAGLSIWELDDEILELAVASGMYRIDLPIESGSKKVRKEIMEKDFYDVDRISKIIKKCREIGVERIYGYVMLGNPGEDKKTLQETLDTLNELDLDYKGVRFAKPFPNTRFYEICTERGYLSDDFSFNDLWFAKPVIATEEFDIPYLTALVQADRSLAMKRLGIQGLPKSAIEVFKKWGISVGIRWIAKVIELSIHYKSLKIPVRPKKTAQGRSISTRYYNMKHP